eukprot:TRINITY_DN73754_c0_g1_i1.p1 TRINITY_DN73754_c0_g1~~TRINITY_DN73754_c0_g1_i1.p1  ORF type:complete len:559 (-),score=102.93 TRINITY_DN73754_c0_g1_i1:201-1877(-)
MSSGTDVVDPQRLAVFQQQLGITPREEEDFGWIAEVGLQSPLPPRWTSHTDEGSDCIYYVDHDCQVSTWENPLVPYLRRVVEIGRAYLQQPPAEQVNFFDDQKGLLWHQHKHDLDCWNGPFTDPEGKLYYINATAGISSWQDPRIDAQYIFELESGLISSLQDVLPAPDPETPGFDNTSGAQTWKTEDGAEVLTLDPERPSTTRSRKKKHGRHPTTKVLTVAHKTAKEETKSTVDTMGNALDQLHESILDEEEAQRLHLAKKAKARRQRIQRARAKAQSGGAEFPLDARPSPLQLDKVADNHIGVGSDQKGALLPMPLLPALPPTSSSHLPNPLVETQAVSAGVEPSPPLIPQIETLTELPASPLPQMGILAESACLEPPPPQQCVEVVAQSAGLGLPPPPPPLPQVETPALSGSNGLMPPLLHVETLPQMAGSESTSPTQLQDETHELSTISEPAPLPPPTPNVVTAVPSGSTAASQPTLQVETNVEHSPGTISSQPRAVGCPNGLGPPALPPSPKVGKRIGLAGKLEQRLAAMEQQRLAAAAPQAFTNLDLKASSS